MTTEEIAEEVGAGPAENDPDLVPLDEAAELIESKQAQILDVRTEHEWNAGHIPGARHVPLVELSEVAGELGKDEPFLVICRGGNRSAFAAEGLRSAGFQARAVAGGMLAWEEAGRPLEPEGGYVAESGQAAAVLEARERQGIRPRGIDW